MDNFFELSVSVSLGMISVGVVAALVVAVMQLRRLEGAVDDLRKSSSDYLKVAHRMDAAMDDVTHVASVVRREVDRMRASGAALGDELGSVRDSLLGSLSDFAATVDFAQSEAEAAVLDAAVKVRTLRAKTDFLRRKDQTEDEEEESRAAESLTPGEGEDAEDESSPS